MTLAVPKIKTTNKKTFEKFAIGAAVLLPAYYMTKLHVDMYDKSDKQNRHRIRNKMLGFFAGVGVSVALIHKRILPKTNRYVKLSFALITPYLGLKAAKFYNKSVGKN